MARLNQPLYNQRPNLGKFITSDSGSYKEVEVYEFGVLKCADPDAESPNYGYYNSNGDWISTGDDNWGDEIKNSYEEIAGEFNYILSHPASPVLAPILWGDESEFIMAKVQVASDTSPKVKLNKALLEIKSKRILIKVLRLCSYAKINTALSSVNVRFYSFDPIIKFGIEQGLSEDNIAKTVYHFLRLDACGGIMSDMHNGNFGLYKNRIVTFDLGLAGHNNSSSFKEFIKVRREEQVNRIRQNLEDKIDTPLYRRLVTYKRDKKAINFEYQKKKYYKAKIVKINVEHTHSYSILFNNGVKIYSYNMKSFVIF